MRVCIDLHNHSCLSPCASNSMLPSLLAYEAYEQGIDILALTDHNSTRNIEVFAESCELVGIQGIFGLEVTTVEEVHLLCLFEKPSEANEFGLFIERSLPSITNSITLFGDQLIVDVSGEECEQFSLCLYNASSFSFEEIVHRTLSMGGLAIPAHIDRHANSVQSNLGFLPDLPYSAVEVISLPPRISVLHNTVIQGSDAHYLEHIGRRRCFIEASGATFTDLKEALWNKKVSYLQKM